MKSNIAPPSVNVNPGQMDPEEFAVYLEQESTFRSTQEPIVRAVLEPASHWETELTTQLETDVMRAVAKAKYLRKGLADVARNHGCSLEIVEQIANRLSRDRFGYDLEQTEFNNLVEQVRAVEAIIDPGLREFKLEKLSRQFRIPKQAMMSAYHKALINQAPFQAYNVDQLRTLCDATHKWLVRGWIPAGIVLLLHAFGGTGKSLMMYELIECISKGLPWNGYQVDQGRVLILQSDEPVVVTHDRLSQRDISAAIPVQVVPGWQVEHIAQLEAYLKEWQDAGDPVKFVMVDSITAINRNTMISENDTEYARFMLQFGDLASRYGCTFVVVHHSNGFGEARGTKALYNSASEVWGLLRADEQTSDRTLRVQKTRMGRPPGRYKFLFDDESFTFAYLGREGDGDGEETAHSEKRIELYLNEDDKRGTPYTAEEIAHHLQLNDHTTRRLLKEMYHKGVLTRYKPEHSKAFVYYVGQQLITKLCRSVGDQLGDQESSPELAISHAESTIFSATDQLITQNADFPLLGIGKNGDQLISCPPEGTSKVEHDCDAPTDHPTDHQLITTPISADHLPLIDNGLTQLNEGDLVIPGGGPALVCIKGSGMPSCDIPPMYADAETIRMMDLSIDVQQKLLQPSRVIAVDWPRALVRSPSGQNTVLFLKDLTLLDARA
jgi:AAA domain